MGNDRLMGHNEREELRREISNVPVRERDPESLYGMASTTAKIIAEMEERLRRADEMLGSPSHTKPDDPKIQPQPALTALQSGNMNRLGDIFHKMSMLLDHVGI